MCEVGVVAAVEREVGHLPRRDDLAFVRRVGVDHCGFRGDRDRLGNASQRQLRVDAPHLIGLEHEALCTNFRKRASSTLRSYRPGGSCGSENVPSELVVVVIVSPVPSCVTETVAPGRAAPVGSTTVPTTVALKLCACAVVGSARAMRMTSTAMDELH
jgi:hypothetical protein